MPDIVLMAAGGHGRVVLEALQSAGARVAGIVDPGLPAGALVLGVPVLGGDEWLDRCASANVRLVNGVGLGSGRAPRQRLFEAWTSRGFEFVSVRHPSAVVSPSASLDLGSQVMAGAVVQGGGRIGRNAVVNTRASVDHDCILHDHAFLAPGVVLCGEVSIGEGALIGAGAVVLPRVTVGKGSTVAAGAIVRSDVAESALWKHEPAPQGG